MKLIYEDDEFSIDLPPNHYLTQFGDTVDLEKYRAHSVIKYYKYKKITNIHKLILRLQSLRLLEFNKNLFDKIEEKDDVCFRDSDVIMYLFMHYGPYGVLTRIADGKFRVDYDKLCSLQDPRIDDELLERCAGKLTLRKVTCQNNPNITTLSSIAAELNHVDASGSSGITDAGLADVTKLIYLDAGNNEKINNIDRFAQTLEYLDFRGINRNENENLLRYAFKLKTFIAPSNMSRTPLNACRNTLEKLYAAGICTVTTTEISVLTKLVFLDARDNPRITDISTKCKQTLKYLDASGHMCGIDDRAISNSCVEILHVSNNPRITSINSCKYIKELYASDNSGINDLGLSECRSPIAKLSVINNPRITTVRPFVKTLETLYATNNSGINDAGLEGLERLEILWIFNNPKVTRCESFEKTIKELYAPSEFFNTTEVLYNSPNLYKTQRGK